MSKIFDMILTGANDLGRALRGEPRVMHTKFGDLLLADNSKRKQVKKIVSCIQRTTESLTQSDIQKWRRAHQMAIRVENPDRRMLYDIYRDTELDGHLSGCVEQRHGFVLAKAYNIEDKNKTPQDSLKHYFEQPWFEELCRLILSANEWGHSLIELGDIVTDGDGCPCYENVTLIDRKYVIPEYHRVITDLGQDWTTGIDYHDPQWSQNLIEAGNPTDLGVYLKAAQYTIPKKNVLAAWDVFGELFGIPFRMVTTNARDEDTKKKISSMLEQMGTSAWGLFPEGTTLQFIESAKSDAFNVFNQRVSRSNSEISKLIIGQTMTIEDGSSLSQSQTHLKVLENLVEKDAKMLEHIVNNQLIPRMIRQGFPLQGMHFAWDESIDYTPEQQMEYKKMVADRYEVDGKYFADKYNMPVGERIHQADPFGMQPADDSKKDDDKKDDNKKDDNKKDDDKKDDNHQKNFFD